MASSSFPPRSRRALAHLLRNGVTVEAGDAEQLRLAEELAQVGLVRLTTRQYVRCAYPPDEDYLEVFDPGCEGRIEAGAAPADCPLCGRTIEYPGFAKRVFAETALTLAPAAIAEQLFAMLGAASGVASIAPLNAFAADVHLELAGEVVLYLADSLGRQWRGPGRFGRLPHVALAGGSAPRVSGAAGAVALADWLTHEPGWLVAQLARVAGDAPIAHRTRVQTAALAGEGSPPGPGTQLEIRIDPCGAQGYPVEFNLGGNRHFLGHAGTLSPSTSAPGAGRALFDWLCADPELAAGWRTACEAPTPLHIRLRLVAQELHTLPWEAMWAAVDGAWVNVAAADATPLARYLAFSGRPRRAVRQGLARLLVAVAAPDDLAAAGMAPIDREGEWQNLGQSLGHYGATMRLMPAPCTLAALERRLRDGYHCLHLVAHGASGADGPYLFLEDEQGCMAPVAGAAVAETVARVAAGGATALRLVFLDACHAGAPATAAGVQNLAIALLRASVPAVVAMQDGIDVTASRRFAREFYRQLFAHGLVDLAANQARATLLTCGLPGSAVPVLYTRLAGGALFDMAGAEAPPQEVFGPEH